MAGRVVLAAGFETGFCNLMDVEVRQNKAFAQFLRYSPEGYAPLFVLFETRNSHAILSQKQPLRSNMKSQTEADFLRQLETRGIIIDPQYPQMAILKFRGAERDARYWVVPKEPELRPFFFATILQTMGDWGSCFVWRHMGSWPSQENAGLGDINDCVEAAILSGLGIPVGTSSVLEFTRDETTALVTLLFATSVFGWSVEEDVYLVPDHGRFILQTDHHGVIHVEFSLPANADAWVSAMAESGFPLPDEPPDATFKPVGWMVQKT